MVERPQDVDCATVEFPTPGHANGAISLLAEYYEVEYDEEDDIFRFGERL
jgi:hypothetical protein